MEFYEDIKYLFNEICNNVRVFSLIITDKNNIIKKVNKGAEFTFGVNSKELINKNIKELFIEESKFDEILEAISFLDIVRRQFKFKKYGGEIFIGDLLVSKLSNEKNELQGYLYFIFDITEHKKLEESIEKQNIELMKLYNYAQEANKAKSIFLANMSHELRTPLTAILGFSEILLEEKVGKLNEVQKDFISDIYKSGKHLLQLINDILDLSKVEAEKMEFLIEKVNLIEVIQSSKSLIKPLVLNKSLKVIDELPAKEVYVKADETRTKQILYNLYSNAVKFTPSGGTITTKLETDENFAYVSVIDTGVGIKKEDQNIIFEEFVQIQNPYTKQYAGTGLGLALVKKFLEKMGGEIRVFSEGENKGSTFTFKLPLWKE